MPGPRLWVQENPGLGPGPARPQLPTNKKLRGGGSKRGEIYVKIRIKNLSKIFFCAV